MNPFSLASKTLTPVKRKIFSVYTLWTMPKVIGTKSWLENTLDRKKKRIEKGTSNNEMLSLAICSRLTLSKVKNHNTLSILGRDADT